MLSSDKLLEVNALEVTSAVYHATDNESNSLFSKIDATVHFKVVNEEDGESHDRLIDGPRY